MNRVLFLVIFLFHFFTSFAQWGNERCLYHTQWGQCTNNAILNKLFCEKHLFLPADSLGMLPSEEVEEMEDKPVEGRCKAITKSGKQCSRMAKDDSGFCWQHKGSQSTSSTTTTTYSSSGGRCRAKTKSGRQCSRSARSNGFCWQHGG